MNHLLKWQNFSKNSFYGQNGIKVNFTEHPLFWPQKNGYQVNIWSSENGHGHKLAHVYNKIKEKVEGSQILKTKI